MVPKFRNRVLRNRGGKCVSNCVLLFALVHKGVNLSAEIGFVSGDESTLVLSG